MGIGLEVVIAVIAATLVVVSVVGMAIGVETWLAGERFERCPSCHRLGLTARGVRHPAGCRPGLLDRVPHPARDGISLHLHGR